MILPGFPRIASADDAPFVVGTSFATAVFGSDTTLVASAAIPPAARAGDLAVAVIVCAGSGSSHNFSSVQAGYTTRQNKFAGSTQDHRVQVLTKTLGGTESVFAVTATSSRQLVIAIQIWRRALRRPGSAVAQALTSNSAAGFEVVGASRHSGLLVFGMFSAGLTGAPPAVVMPPTTEPNFIQATINSLNCRFALGFERRLADGNTGTRTFSITGSYSRSTIYMMSIGP